MTFAARGDDVFGSAAEELSAAWSPYSPELPMTSSRASNRRRTGPRLAARPVFLA